MPDKGFVSRKCRRVSKLNDKKMNEQIKKWAKDSDTLAKKIYDGKGAPEKTFIIISYHQGNVN